MRAPQRLSRLVAGALRLGAARPVALVFVLALAVWWLEALIIPLAGGRDLATYLGAYLQLTWAHPVDLGYVLGRTPLSPLVVGGILDFAHGALAEPIVSLLYAASIVAWFVAARTFSRNAAILTTVVLLAYPGYGILFHELSSDAVFAAAFAGWSLLVVRALVLPTWRRFALVGAGVGVLVLVRPSNQILLLLALLPLALRVSWRRRGVLVVAFLVPALVLVGGLVLNNGIRYDDYVVVRGGNATVPFYRTFVTDHIVRPSNGPATRDLARAVQRDLLPKEPYRSYGITLEKFFHGASPRMEVDLVALSDRLKGWYTNDRWLRDVGIEAIRAHPTRYARGVLGSTWGMLTEGLFRAPSAPVTAPASSGGGGGGATGPTVVVNGRRLPQPSEGEPIPAPHEGGITTPDGSIYTVWTSPIEHHMVFVHPKDAERNAALHRRMDALASNFPHRGGIPSLAHRFNQASRWFPPPLVWLVLGLVALLLRRSRWTFALVVPMVAGLLVIVVSALGLPAEPHYSLPVAPAFVLFGAGTLFAPRRELAIASVRRTLGVGVGVLAAIWAVKIYATGIRNYVDGTGPQHDLAVFLGAAGRVLAGASPYGFHGDKTFAYPPFLAYIVAPLHPLDGWAAALIWMLLSLAAILAALWLLGVRDWRCYAFAGLFRFTRSSIDLGTVEPLLLLAVAAAWRWRETLLRSAAGAGTAIVLKLFLWPLVIWLGLMQRIRAAVGAIAIAVGIAVVTWAAIGFAGLGDYPSVLTRLADHESTSSYSVVALGVRAHLPLVAARIVSVLVGLTLLGAAAWVARDRKRTFRNRDLGTLTLTLAAALAASPIVWVHYFLLLLVPLALASPRLSWLWFVPFAYTPLGEAAWPAGNARNLALALVATLVILGAAVVRSAGNQIAFQPERTTDPVEGPSRANGRPLRLSSWSRIRSGT